MTKRKSTAGKLAQALYDAWRADGPADPLFPKTDGYTGGPSIWASSADAALKYLKDAYGFDPDADYQHAGELVQERLVDDLREKNATSPPPEGFTWSLGYDTQGQRRPERDVAVKIPEGFQPVVRDEQQEPTCAKCSRKVRAPGLLCGVHTNQRVGEAFGLSVAPPAKEPDSFTAIVERAMNFTDPSPGVVKFGLGAPLAEYEDRPETWPVGTEVRVGTLVGKTVKTPARVRVEFPADSHGQRHSGEFLTKFVHRVPETSPPVAKVWPGVSAADVDREMVTRHPGGWIWAGTAPALDINRLAVYCTTEGCTFYRENWLPYGYAVLEQGEQHHRENGTHTVHVKRNPEETREQVKR
jgi:hypothetical protein